MKFVVSLKDPDGFAESIRDAIEDELLGTGLPADERAALFSVRRQKVGKFMEKWVDGAEYVTIEFDMENNTATVLRLK